MAPPAIALLLAWALFAFGAVYPWASIPVLILAPIVCLIARPALFAPGTRVLDAAVLATVLAAAFQLVPLPPSLRLWLSPASQDYVSRTALGVAANDAWRPLSLVPQASRLATGLLVAAAALFWAARGDAHTRGFRVIARGITRMGLVASLVALVQPALIAGHKIYGFWQPESIEARPIGPIVSRNHFAAWIVLALPIAAGYLVAHVQARWMNDRSRFAAVLSDTRALWLLAAGGFMAAALLLTHSRSGVIGASVALLVGLVRHWRGMGTVGRVGLSLYVLGLAVAVIVMSDPNIVAVRFDLTLADAWGGRPEIWRETMGLIGRYWPAGVGVGTFDVVMAVYQTATRAVLFNHAHNQYLNFFAEGGLLVAGPAAVAVVAFFGLAGRRLRQDITPLAHVRAGALAGIAGLMVQSFWETPLLTPAVLFLMAVSAGLAVAPLHAQEVAG